MSERYEQSESEIQAQVGAGSNGQFAMDWAAGLFVGGDWAASCANMTAAFLNAHVVNWVAQASTTGELGDRSPEEVAAGLLAVDQEDPSWEAFALANLRHYFPMLGDAAPHLAVGSRPRPVGPSTEEFWFVDYRDVPAAVSEVAGAERRQLQNGQHPAVLIVEVETAVDGPRVAGLRPGPALASRTI